jgi:hypothetical protein
MPDDRGILAEEAGQTSTAQAELIPEAIGLTDPKRFILAGRAIFTLQGKETRYTYRVNRSEPKEGSPYTSPAYFVSLLTGPDNTADYTYLGMLDPASGTVRLTRKSQYNDTSKPVQAIQWAFGRIWNGRPLDPARMYHIGRCGRCGRALTVPASIEAGIGPECAGKL